MSEAERVSGGSLPSQTAKPRRTSPRIPSREREGRIMPLDAETAGLLEAHLGDRNAVRTVIFGRCWADSPSSWVDDLRVPIIVGETIIDCAERLDLAWNPRW